MYLVPFLDLDLRTLCIRDVECSKKSIYAENHKESGLLTNHFTEKGFIENENDNRMLTL